MAYRVGKKLWERFIKWARGGGTKIEDKTRHIIRFVSGDKLFLDQIVTSQPTVIDMIRVVEAGRKIDYPERLEFDNVCLSARKYSFFYTTYDRETRTQVYIYREVL